MMKFVNRACGVLGALMVMLAWGAIAFIAGAVFVVKDDPIRKSYEDLRSEHAAVVEHAADVMAERDSLRELARRRGAETDGLTTALHGALADQLLDDPGRFQDRVAEVGLRLSPEEHLAIREQRAEELEPLINALIAIMLDQDGLSTAGKRAPLRLLEHEDTR
jgi:hypothetical protein